MCKCRYETATVLIYLWDAEQATELCILNAFVILLRQKAEKSLLQGKSNTYSEEDPSLSLKDDKSDRKDKKITLLVAPG
jgi:hypothetical protein